MLAACSPMETRQQEAPDTVEQEAADTGQQEAPVTAKGIEIGGKTFESYTLWVCSDIGYNKPPILWFVKTNITFEDVVKEFVKSDKDAEKKFQENKEELKKNLQELSTTLISQLMP